MTDTTPKTPAQTTVPAAGRFARLPNAWIIDGGLRELRTAAKVRGETGAALKLYIAILLRAENKAAAEAGATQGSAALTYSELEELADLSRGLVARGVKRLKALSLVTVVPEGRGRKSRYFVNDYGKEDRWGKMASARLYGQGSITRVRVLHELSLRNEADMNALKLYLLFCAVYDRSRQGALIGYNLIEMRTGISQSRIRQALSVLYEHRLIRAEAAQVAENGKNAPHLYRVLGI